MANPILGRVTWPERAVASQMFEFAWHYGSATLFRNVFARASEIGGKIFELWQPISHTKNCFSVVDVEGRLKFQCRQRGRIHIDQSQRRMICHKMPPALLTILPLTHGCFLEHADLLGASRNPYGLRFPKRESVDGSA